MDKYEHIEVVENKMNRAYARLHSTLYRDHYKKHFEGIDERNVEQLLGLRMLGGKQC
jgi:hypothetical protein